MYACEVFQWDEFLDHWMQYVMCIENEDGNKSMINETVFKKSLELKNKVLGIIHASKGLKDDIASLRESISHLSSIIQENIRASLAKEGSTLKQDVTKSLSDEDYSMPISSECSHHEVTIRNNI